MAFTVQNDTGTQAGANSYLSLADFRAYWADRGDDTSTITDASAQALLVKATQYIDLRFPYYGEPLEGRDQSTEFPRDDLWDQYANEVSGIPQEVKDACAEYAYHANTTSLTNTATGTDPQVVKEKDKVDVLETEREYAGTKTTEHTWNVYQVADNILLRSGFVVVNWGMQRA